MFFTPNPLLSPKPVHRWHIDRQRTLHALLELVEGDPTLQNYAGSYFARGADDVVITNPEQFFCNDAVVIGNRTYPFPSNVLFQAVSRILSREATRVYFHNQYNSTILVEAAVRHVQIQYTSAGSSAYIMPSVFSAFAIVNDNNQIVQMLFSCSPGGTYSTRDLIRQNRKSSFYSEWQKFDDEHHARCQRIECLRSENSRSIESQDELSELYKHTVRGRDVTYCAESEIFFPLEAHAINEPIYASTHRVFVLSVHVVREGAEDFIVAKEFYGNCFGIKMELGRKWRRIVDASLVRAHEQLGYLS